MPAHRATKRYMEAIPGGEVPACRQPTIQPADRSGAPTGTAIHYGSSARKASKGASMGFAPPRGSAANFLAGPPMERRLGRLPLAASAGGAGRQDGGGRGERTTAALRLLPGPKLGQRDLRRLRCLSGGTRQGQQALRGARHCSGQGTDGGGRLGADRLPSARGRGADGPDQEHQHDLGRQHREGAEEEGARADAGVAAPARRQRWGRGGHGGRGRRLRGREGRGHREVVEHRVLTAAIGGLLLAGALAVGPLAVHPHHLVAAPVADDGRHARRHRGVELGHAGVAANAGPEWAVLAVLGKRDLHGLQAARIVHGEVDGDLEGQLRVHALAAGAELLSAPVARPAPAEAAPAVAPAQAAMVRRGVQGGVPSIAIALLDVDLGAGPPADVVGVAVVVPTVGRILVLSHGGEVEGGVAAAAGLGEVRGVDEGLPPEVPRLVLGCVVLACSAVGSKV
mmetsp:Transcript_141484/g.439796  ORF Transcript_141484/g.439796 Transcript_141484/m.439796 type:complete len:454 (-) Transcript_141484:100-1461(-)